MVIVVFFIFGICVGSFLNVLIDRLSRDEKITGRSYCESCKKQLHFFDLVPVLSFVLLRGTCRYCRVKLSFYYPIVELTTGVSFVLTAFYFGIRNQESGIMDWTLLFFHLFIVSSLTVIFFTDLKYRIIPEKILYPAILLTVLYFFLIHDSLFLIRLVSGLGAALFFLLLFLATKGKGMGLGDVQYAFFMGVFLGFPKIIFGLYSAFLTGAFLSLILILLGKKKLRGDSVPFGPFLVLGTVMGYVWGEWAVRFLFGI